MLNWSLGLGPKTWDFRLITEALEDRGMAFFLNLASNNIDLLKFERQATRTLDSTSASYPNGIGSATSSINNLNGITTTISQFATYISDAKDAYLVLSDASKGLGEIQSKLNDLKTIANMGQSVSFSTELRDQWDGTFKTYIKDILNVANSMQFQQTNLLDGSFNNQNYTTGPNSRDAMNISIGDHTPYGLKIASLDIESSYNAGQALDTINSALDTINASINSIGSAQARLNSTLDENNIKFVKIPDTSFRYDNLPTTETKNYSVELQKDRYKYIDVSNLKNQTTEFKITSDNKNYDRNPSINTQKLVVFLYEKNDLNNQHKFSLNL